MGTCAWDEGGKGRTGRDGGAAEREVGGRAQRAEARHRAKAARTRRARERGRYSERRADDLGCGALRRALVLLGAGLCALRCLVPLCWHRVFKLVVFPDCSVSKKKGEKGKEKHTHTKKAVTLPTTQNKNQDFHTQKCHPSCCVTLEHSESE